MMTGVITAIILFSLAAVIAAYFLFRTRQSMSLSSNRKSVTPLHKAIDAGDMEKVKTMLSEVDSVDSLLSDGSTALIHAISRKRSDLIPHLLSLDADVNKEDISGTTPLHYAALHGDINLVKLLIEKGAEISVKNNAGFTPLHYVAGTEKTDIAALLVEMGADINACSNKGLRPIDIAETSQAHNMMDLLQRPRGGNRAER